MKIFWDSEFTGLHQDTTFISLGMVAENRRTFYAEFTDFSLDYPPGSWTNEEEVISNLYLPDDRTGLLTEGATTQVRGDVSTVKNELEKWLFGLYTESAVYGDLRNMLPDQYPKPLILWGDVSAYDWILLCQLWGHAFNIPKFIYYIPFDLATLFKAKGIDPNINREAFSGHDKIAAKHNALWDAQVIKACYEKLTSADNEIWYTS